MTIKTCGYAAPKAKAPLEPFKFERRDVGPQDVRIRILFCGICHSDIHQAQEEWGSAIFPMVPGHEFVGRVEQVGGEVTKFKAGDIAAVGCWLDSCRHCEYCDQDEEQLCQKRVPTYNGRYHDGTPTFGGYSKEIVVLEHFVLKVPDALKTNLAGVAPLLCAGITMYTPMTRYGMNKAGTRIAVVGLGGLGHMAVKFGVAWGCEVTVFSTSTRKRDLALKQLGASRFLISKDEEEVSKYKGYFDFILDTVCVPKTITAHLDLLAPTGRFLTVALPGRGAQYELHPGVIIMGEKAITGSCVGGLARHQQMLDFCGEKGIFALVEVITLDKVNEAYKRVEKSDVLFRFSIDISKSLGD